MIGIDSLGVQSLLHLCNHESNIAWSGDLSFGVGRRNGILGHLFCRMVGVHRYPKADAEAMYLKVQT